MSIPNTTGLKRKPTHPGEMLREDFLPDFHCFAASRAFRLRFLCPALPTGQNFPSSSRAFLLLQNGLKPMNEKRLAK